MTGVQTCALPISLESSGLQAVEGCCLGRQYDELHAAAITVFLGLWIAARFGLPYVHADGFFITCVAILDIALVFTIFKADVPLT